MKFTVIKKEGTARRGVFETVHGTVQTPAFMNVATCGAIKARSHRMTSRISTVRFSCATHIICICARATSL